MPCCLKRTENPDHFSAPAESKVTVSIRPHDTNQGATVKILSIEYDGATKTDEPFKFTLVSDWNFLGIMVVASKALEVDLFEICGNGVDPVVLKTYNHDPASPSIRINICGTSP